MVMIRQGGHIGFDAVTNIPPAPSTMQYIQQGLDKFKTHLNPMSLNLFENAYNKIAMYDYGKLQQLAQATGRYLDSLWLPNEILPLQSIGHLQHAPPVMIRWLMAEPTIRQLYHNGEAQGYGDDYIDTSPSAIGEEHRDWRIVMDGIVVDTEEESYAVQYFPETDFEFNADHDQINFIDQCNIMNSWSKMAYYANLKEEDPTSKFNARL